MEHMNIIQQNIANSKNRIESEIGKDYLIIIITRIIEDIKVYKNPNLYGRIKELCILINPYSKLKDTKKIYNNFMNLDLSGEWGLRLTDKEADYIDIIRNNLNIKCELKNPSVMKGRVNGMLNKLVKKYLPETSELLNAYTVGKLISSMGCLKNLCFRAAGTIQLIGAEKALFRHKRNKNSKSPKYGLLFKTREIQQSKNKGRSARRLSNKLVIAMRKDYFNLYDGK